MPARHARSELRTLKHDLYARGEPAPEALQQGLHLLEQSDLRATLPALSVPTLWLAGRRDLLVPTKAMQASAAVTPQATFVEIAGGGHAPFLGHADHVAADVARFMQTLPQGATA